MKALKNRVSKLEGTPEPQHKPYVSVVIKTDGSCFMLDSDLTFPSEQAFDEHFKDKDVNIIKRRIINVN